MPLYLDADGSARSLSKDSPVPSVTYVEVLSHGGAVQLAVGGVVGEGALVRPPGANYMFLI